MLSLKWSFVFFLLSYPCPIFSPCLVLMCADVMFNHCFAKQFVNSAFEKCCVNKDYNYYFDMKTFKFKDSENCCEM